MSYNQINCSDTDLGPIGFNCDSNLNGTKMLIFTKLTTEFAAETNVLTLADWQTLIQDEDIWIIMVDSIEDQSKEDTVEEAPISGKTYDVVDGKRGVLYNIKLPLCVHQELRSFNRQSLKVMKVDQSKNILGTSSDGTKFAGFSTSQIKVKKMGESDGTTIRPSQVYIEEESIAEWDDDGVFAIPTAFNPFTELKSLIGVTITVESAIITKVVVKVVSTCGGKEIVGLVKEDFILNVGQTIVTSTDNGDGTYDLNGAGLVTGTVELADPSDMTTEGYKGAGSAVVTI